MDGTAVKSAFALLSAKVTKPMRRIRRGLPGKSEKGQLIEKNNQCDGWKGNCKSQQQKISCKEHRPGAKPFECGILQRKY